MKVKSISKLVLVLLIIAGLIWLSICGLSINGKTYIKKASEGIRYGLDIAGGTTVTYEAKADSISAEEASTVIDIMRARLDGAGYQEATVTREGDKRFTVEIPGVTETKQVISILGQTAKLTFVTADGQVVLEGKNVESAVANTTADQSTGKPINIVSLKFDKDGTKAFADATMRSVGQPIMIMLDTNIISAPTVNEAITNGEAMISGDFTMEKARELASLINSGNLPVELEEISSTSVDATLGSNALKDAVTAGLISLIIIMIYMILFYRLPGLMSAIALTFYTVLVILVMSITKTNLTLSGIAGVVLSMGMAVDANVVIFERIIDELKLGKSAPAAVNAGFNRALTAVIDSNVTTIISCAVLYFLGTGTVKGFAITLLIGVAVSMFTAIVVTKFLLRRMVELGIRNRKLYGFGIKA